MTCVICVCTTCFTVCDNIYVLPHPHPPVSLSLSLSTQEPSIHWPHRIAYRKESEKGGADFFFLLSSAVVIYIYPTTMATTAAMPGDAVVASGVGRETQQGASEPARTHLSANCCIVMHI